MFITKAPEEVLQTSLERLVRETPITVTSPGGIARTFYEIVADEIGTDFALLDANVSQMFLSTAGGRGLDLLGQIYGVTRKTVSGAILANESNVMFYLSDQQTNPRGIASHPAPTDITIPTGTLISTEQIGNVRLPQSWKTSSPTVLAEDEYMAYADVVPVATLKDTTAAGTLIYNNFDRSTVAELDTPDVLYVHVFNKDDLEINTEYESDTNFRFRIKNAILAIATGNATALRLAALGVTGVRDAIVSPLAVGIGTAKVVVVTERPGTTDGDTAFASAMTAINSAASAGDLIQVKRPNELPVDMNITIYYNGSVTSSRKDSINDNVQTAVTRYVNKLSAGEGLRINKLLHEAMSVSPDIADVVILPGIGLQINDVAQPIVDYNVDEEEQLFLNTITASNQ